MKTILKRNGQATLELSLIVGVLFLLLLGVVRIGGWFNSDLANRQATYKQTRVAAGQGSNPGLPYQTPALDILGDAEEIVLSSPSDVEWGEEHRQRPANEAIGEDEAQALAKRFIRLRKLIDQHEKAAKREEQTVRNLERQIERLKSMRYAALKRYFAIRIERLERSLEQHRQAAEEHRQLAEDYQNELDSLYYRVAAGNR